jgi:hypothetical protein
VSDGGHQVRGQEESAADAAAVSRGGLDAHDPARGLAVERREDLGSAAARCGVGIGCRGGGWSNRGCGGNRRGVRVRLAMSGAVLTRVAPPPKMAGLRAIPATRSALASELMVCACATLAGCR